MFVLDALVIDERIGFGGWIGSCQPVLNKAYRGLGLPSWVFGCGLKIASELAHEQTEWWRELGQAHLRHHQEGHQKTDWTLILSREELHREEKDGWVRMKVYCECAAPGSTAKEDRHALQE